MWKQISEPHKEYAYTRYESEVWYGDKWWYKVSYEWRDVLNIYFPVSVEYLGITGRMH